MGHFENEVVALGILSMYNKDKTSQWRAETPQSPAKVGNQLH